MKKLKLTRDWPCPLPPRDPNYVRDFPLTTLEAQEMAKKKAAKAAAGTTAMKDAGDPSKNDPNQPLLPGMEEERIAPIERAKKVKDK